MGIGSRLAHAWNAFTDQNTQVQSRPLDFGTSYGVRPDRVRLNIANERSIVTAIYVRLAIDIASISFRHVRLDDARRYKEDIDSGLNNCLTVEANIDQAAQHFIQDVALTMFDQGTIAIVPIDTDLSPFETGGFDILTMRVGTITGWRPRHVKVSLYNDQTGRREELLLEKKSVAIVENPFYSIMNEPNSTLQRLIRKLSLLDAVDEQSASGKLDLIIQLPYVVKSETRRQQAQQRRTDIEMQLKGSKYGIAYTDGTEKITQLNRPSENNLMGQITYLVEMLYSQLGITPAIMDGTADEKTMLNYNNRTIAPIADAITSGMKRSFLTKTARTQKQTIMYFRDPFKLVPLANIAEIADKFTRNEILSANEIRGFIGIQPSPEAKADMLINSNMPVDKTGVAAEATPTAPEDDGTGVVNDAFDQVDAEIDRIFGELGVTE